MGTSAISLGGQAYSLPISLALQHAVRGPQVLEKGERPHQM